MHAEVDARALRLVRERVGGTATAYQQQETAVPPERLRLGLPFSRGSGLRCLFP